MRKVVIYDYAFAFGVLVITNVASLLFIGKALSFFESFALMFLSVLVSSLQDLISEVRALRGGKDDESE
jgi:hypothetical protein